MVERKVYTTNSPCLRSGTSARAVLFLVFISFTSGAVAQPGMRDVGWVAEADKLRSYIQYLAGDDLEGRRTGTRGNLYAAGYIAGMFSNAGLEKVNGTFFHTFPHISGVSAGPMNAMALRTPKGKRQLIPGTEFTPMSFSESETLAGELVFVGYGITVPEKDYDDYAGIDAAGKIVVMMRNAPDGDNPHSDFARYAAFTMKVHNAREHRAKGIIIIEQPNGETPGLIPMQLLRNFTQSGIVVMNAHPDVFADVRSPSGKSLSQIQTAIDTDTKPHSFTMAGYSVDMTTDVQMIRDTVANVIGVVPGTDSTLKDEYIVVGAHFDHLGHGGEGSLHRDASLAIHHGADDNASGTAVVMVLAEKIARSHTNKRSIIFMAFNGEEEGLLGSAYLVDNPPFNLGNVVAMINLDMIGRLDSSKLIVHGTGTSSGWEQLLNGTNSYGLRLSFVKDGYGPSDHSSFYSKEIPVLFFFTGLHEDYHRPSDTWEKVNYDGCAVVMGYVLDVLRGIDATTARPDFIKVQRQEQQATRFRVYVGTIPDYGYDGKGLRITDVAEGGPAEEGGLEGGDVIIKFGGKEINNIYDYTYALSEFEPKQEVDVVVIRNGEELTKKILLRGR